MTVSQGLHGSGAWSQPETVFSVSGIGSGTCLRVPAGASLVTSCGDLVLFGREESRINFAFTSLDGGQASWSAGHLQDPEIGRHEVPGDKTVLAVETSTSSVLLGACAVDGDTRSHRPARTSLSVTVGRRETGGQGARRPRSVETPCWRRYFQAIRGASRLRFIAMHTRSHSPLTFSKPRIENCLNPIAALIHPNGGSAMTLRRR